jgi:hypothetical protein
MRRLVAAVAVAGPLLAACSSSTPAPFRTEAPIPGSAIAARVVADDPEFDPAATRRPHFVPCSGLSGCARSSPQAGEYYPGVTLPANVDDEVDYTQQFVIYLAGAEFEDATLDGPTVHVRLTERSRGFQMVKLAQQDVLTLASPTFSFVTASGTALCSASWEGCSP